VGQKPKEKYQMKPKCVTQWSAVVSACRSSLPASILFLTVCRAPASLAPGEIVDWGQNLMPVPPPSIHYTAVAAADADNLALKDDGTLVAWSMSGIQWSDILTNTAATLSNVTAIAAIQNVNMVLFKNGTVYAWGGDDNEGMTNVPPGLSNVMAIALGAYHSLALQTNGTIVSWGGDYGDESGNTVLPPTNSLITAIASGLTHGLALTSDGTVLPWGNLVNLSGNVIKPVDPSYLVNAKAIAAGDYHALVLKTDGTVAAWGENDDGECNVPSGLTNVVAISAGDGHSVALIADGTVVAWGDNTFGVTNTFGITNAVAISAEYEHTLALIGPLAGTAPSQPPLSKLVSDNEFIVTWPSSFSGFTLETSTNLSKTNFWTSVATQPVVVNSQNTVTNTITNGAHFFRLVK